MQDFVLTGRGVIGPNWMDNNDHMNMMWYTHLIDAATASLLRISGFDQAVGGATFVAARVSTAHRKELILGDAWETWSRIESINSNVVMCVHKVTNGRFIAARSEISIVPFDRSSRTATVLPISWVNAIEAGLRSGSKDI